jgi:hypothetical protein
MHYLCFIPVALCRHISFSTSSVLLSSQFLISRTSFTCIFKIYDVTPLSVSVSQVESSFLLPISFLLSPYLPVLISHKPFVFLVECSSAIQHCLLTVRVALCGEELSYAIRRLNVEETVERR